MIHDHAADSHDLCVGRKPLLNGREVPRTAFGVVIDEVDDVGAETARQRDRFVSLASQARCGCAAVNELNIFVLTLQLLGDKLRGVADTRIDDYDRQRGSISVLVRVRSPSLLLQHQAPRQ